MSVASCQTAMPSRASPHQSHPAAVAPQLHAEEQFHCNLGYKNLARICKTPEGLADAQRLLEKWWPAALDMFGRSSSTTSEAYVKRELVRHRLSGWVKRLFGGAPAAKPQEM